jgi:NADH dehydrogenase FAD-containing subunit
VLERFEAVDADPALLPPFHESSQWHAFDALRARGVEVRLEVTVDEVTPESVRLDFGEVIPTRTLVWAAGMQRGEHVAAQLVATLEGGPTRPFRYVDRGTMATIGRRAAVAELPFGVRLSGTSGWFAWLGLHLVFLVGFRNRASVFLNWAWNHLTWDRGPRLILGPRSHPSGGADR